MSAVVRVPVHAPEPSADVKSARRVFEILEFFASQRTPHKARTIARHLNYPVSSAAALLKSMCASGYLVFDKKSHTYFPSVRLFFLTARLHPLLRSLPRDKAAIVPAVRGKAS